MGLWVSRMLDTLTLTSSMTLTLEFQVQIFKQPYVRNGNVIWHGKKRMSVSRMLDPLSPICIRSIFLIIISRNRRANCHGAKGMCVNRMSDPLSHHPWACPLIFKVIFWNSNTSGIWRPNDTKWKGYDSIGYWTHYVTLNFNTNDHDFGLSRLYFEIALSQKWEGQLTWNEMDVSQ